MKTFITDTFLLSNNYSEELFFNHANNQPIIDFHCHLSPADLAQNKQFKNLTEIWLQGDHYKWRAMRAFGIEERLITGAAMDEQKFEAWSKTVPYTMRNPLYHWTHLELLRYFGITELLNGDSFPRIWNCANEKLQTAKFSALELVKKMNVKVICTTDDPLDDLKHHKSLAKSGESVKMYPTFRPDRFFGIHQIEVFTTYLKRCTELTGIEVHNLQSLRDAIAKRIAVFHEVGCRQSDHGFEQIVAVDFTDTEIESILKKALKNQVSSLTEVKKYQFWLLRTLSELYHAKGWVQQFHLGAIRNNNSRILKTVGADSGVDSMGDYVHAEGLARFLNQMDTTNQLTKTILYNINPAYNEVFATMAANFNDGTVAGKMQYGAAWWFLDQKDGIEKQINSLSNMGLLSQFVGMVTDSRSFLSYTRHEYFRRILCELIGKDVQNGELPNDMPFLGNLVEDICYRNASRYFEYESDS